MYENEINKLTKIDKCFKDSINYYWNNENIINELRGDDLYDVIKRGVIKTPHQYKANHSEF